MAFLPAAWRATPSETVSDATARVLAAFVAGAGFFTGALAGAALADFLAAVFLAGVVFAAVFLVGRPVDVTVSDATARVRAAFLADGRAAAVRAGEAPVL